MAAQDFVDIFRSAIRSKDPGRILSFCPLFQNKHVTFNTIGECSLGSDCGAQIAEYLRLMQDQPWIEGEARLVANALTMRTLFHGGDLGNLRAWITATQLLPDTSLLLRDNLAIWLREYVDLPAASVTPDLTQEMVDAAVRVYHPRDWETFAEQLTKSLHGREGKEATGNRVLLVRHLPVQARRAVEAKYLYDHVESAFLSTATAEFYRNLYAMMSECGDLDVLPNALWKHSTHFIMCWLRFMSECHYDWLSEERLCAWALADTSRHGTLRQGVTIFLRAHGSAALGEMLTYLTSGEAH